MKKKLLSLLTLAMCVTASAITFAACGDNTHTQHTDENGDGKCDVCGYTMTEPTNNEVTDEQWVQAFNAVNNFTLNPYVENTPEDGIIAEADKIQMSDSMIMAKDAEKYYQYVKSENGWIRMEIAEQVYLQTANGIFQYVNIWIDKKAEFTYDNGIYTAASIASDNSNMPTDIKIKFEKGNLVSIEFITTQYDGEPVHNIIDNIGTTTVTLPTVFTEADSGNKFE